MPTNRCTSPRELPTVMIAAASLLLSSAGCPWPATAESTARVKPRYSPGPMLRRCSERPDGRSGRDRFRRASAGERPALVRHLRQLRDPSVPWKSLRFQGAGRGLLGLRGRWAIVPYESPDRRGDPLLDDPRGGVRDPQMYYDGRKILFSYRRGGRAPYISMRSTSTAPACGN